jgi:hypothetical protein
MPESTAGGTSPTVRRYRDCSPGEQTALARLLARFGLMLELVPATADIPGSFWGDEEAGLLDGRLLLRGDTPLHSILHEACHYVCMDPERRAGLDTDAGGGYDEENAVCYLSILLAGDVPGFGAERMMADMDAWGYSFRLGSARDWFERDAGDARLWLRSRGLTGPDGRPAFVVNSTPPRTGD